MARLKNRNIIYLNETRYDNRDPDKDGLTDGMQKCTLRASCTREKRDTYSKKTGEK